MESIRDEQKRKLKLNWSTKTIAVILTQGKPQGKKNEESHNPYILINFFHPLDLSLSTIFSICSHQFCLKLSIKFILHVRISSLLDWTMILILTHPLLVLS